MAINVKPLGDRVIVQPLDEKEVKKGGIIIPDSAKEKPQEGEVISVGAGSRDDRVRDRDRCCRDHSQQPAHAGVLQSGIL